jgi:GNAT superfamily N-acetyltransferase
MLELRPEPPDRPASRGLWEEYMAEVAARLPGFEPTEAIFATEDTFVAEGAAWLVGYEDGRTVCCGGLRPMPGHGGDACELKRMFVTRGARGRGHGHALLAALEGLADERGCRRVRLYTTEVLVEARALYEGSGYEVIRTVRDGERTDLWLEKTLSEER